MPIDPAIPHQCDVPLGPLTWYGVGGSARVLAQPTDVQQLASLVGQCHAERVPIYVLGSGANLLVADVGVDGVVVKLDHEAFKQLRMLDDGAVAGGGYDLAKLILKLAAAGLAGLECLAGIPATVGGAVRMNAGGAFGAIGPFVRRVRVMSAEGEVCDLQRDELRFSYRRSSIDAPFILEVEFELAEGDPGQLRERVKEVFEYKKRTQPLGESSAGCAFKNPQPPADAAHRPCPTDQHLPPAGQLIDMAGLKGFAVGGARVSPHHANFITADRDGGCTAGDVLAVIEHVQRTVSAQFGIELQREVVVWP